MKRFTCIFSLFLLLHTASAQVVFTAIATQSPVIEGEPFQLQFVLEDIDDKSEFQPPDFKGFGFISGPFIYTGTAIDADGIKKLRNIIYTLEALKPGRFTIEGASAKVNGSYLKSNTTIIEVISRTEAVKRNLAASANIFEPNSNSILKPGEDPYNKIRKNLFVKVLVNKRSCFIGEPVTATFKLYSTLESRSDIVKNPGFYGFTVQDMAGLEDNKLSFEIVNGKKFDVHTIRVVQLYPLQAGVFIIDPMEIENKVRLSKSLINKNPEQEIVEGIFADDLTNDENVYENSIHTEAITINVKPYPVKNKPDSFNSATGRFSIDAFVDKSDLIKNEETYLTVTISGKGNFTQLTEPVIQWPAGLEGFESEPTDQLDVKKVPLTGKRIFKFPFIAGRAGNYIIPAINFSFFDPDTNSYKTVSSKEIKIVIREEITSVENTGLSNNSSFTGNKVIIASGIILLLATITICFFLLRKRRKETVPTPAEGKVLPLTIAQIVAPVTSSLPVNDKGFYALLRSCIWNFFSSRFGLYGSNMNRQNLLNVMKQKKVDEKLQEEVIVIIDQCETGIFTDVNGQADRNTLVQRTRAVLEKIDSYCC